jgi:ribosomal-protein-alanine N-acetyltransferase
MFQHLRMRLAFWRERLPPGRDSPPPVLLRTERLLLRELRPEDYPAISAYHDDPLVMRYLVRPGDWSEESEYRTIVGRRLTPWGAGRLGHTLVIVLVEDDALIGDAALAPLPARYGPEGRPALALGFTLSRERWGRGYATEAARELVRFAFEDLDVGAVYGGCLPENSASRRVLEKAGLRFQGSQRGFPGAPRGAESLVFRVDREQWLGEVSEGP